MNIKERFQSMSGMDVNMDYFFYACLEAEKTHRFKNQAATQTWPDLEDALQEGLGGINHLMDDLVAWYAANFPALGDQKVINYDRVNEVADGVARLGVDLRSLVEQLTQKTFVIGEGEGVDAQHNKIWNVFENIVADRFPSHANLYLQYLHWCFHLSRNDENIEVGDRPPVGRFAPSMRQRGQNSHSNGQDRNHKPRNGNGFQNRNGKSRNGRDFKKNDHDSRRNQKGGHRNQNRVFDEDQQHKMQQASQAATDAALMDVKHAIEILNNDPSMSKIALKPCNSFLRRLQHEEAKSLGYNSASIGEGKDRTVVISKSSQSEDASSSQA